MEYTGAMATTRKATKTVAKKAPAKAVKKPVKKSVAKSTKVDYYPNRMTFWISAAAGSLIVLIAVMCAYNR